VEPNFVLGLTVRGIHLAACLYVVGAFTVLLLGGASERPTARAWDAAVMRSARWGLLLALAAGLAALAYQTAQVEGDPAAGLQPRPLLRFLGETQAGHVWLVRHGLLLVLGAFLLAGGDTRRRADWLAARGEAVLLGVAALVLQGASGHAAAVEPATLQAIAIDALHLLAAGAWLGALLPLAALLRMASRPQGADARPYAVLTARRFSRIALAAMVVLVATGVANSLTHVGSIAGLLGSSYGRLLLVKLGLLAPVLALAVVNRRRWLPALGGEAEALGRPAMRGLAATIGAEAALGLGIVGVVAALGLTPPALHQQPTWPLPLRFSVAALDGAPDLKLRALIGSQVAVVGLAGALAALMARAWRVPALGTGGVLFAVGLGLLLPALAIDAYPTTYQRPAVPYHATSIAHGARLFAEHCAVCHGPAGAGDGPAALGLPRPPADLRGAHTGQHTAGDLFWWISHGIARGGMPGFADKISDEERWDVINYVRALAAAEAARGLGPVVEPGQPRLVAPDFTFAVGPMPARALRDYRGRRLVLLVLYTLPGSRPRLAQLAQNIEVLALFGVEIIAVPTDAAPDAIRQLGAEPRILFPVVTDGAGDILTAYGLFTTASHTEFLLDRQGYLRARGTVPGDSRRDLNALLAEVQQLNEEKAAAPAADEHVH
jgi:putative copper resistance protein D